MQCHVLYCEEDALPLQMDIQLWLAAVSSWLQTQASLSFDQLPTFVQDECYRHMAQQAPQACVAGDPCEEHWRVLLFCFVEFQDFWNSWDCTWHTIVYTSWIKPALKIYVVLLKNRIQNAACMKAGHELQWPKAKLHAEGRPAPESLWDAVDNLSILSKASACLLKQYN